MASSAAQSSAAQRPARNRRVPSALRSSGVVLDVHDGLSEAQFLTMLGGGAFTGNDGKVGVVAPPSAVQNPAVPAVPVVASDVLPVPVAANDANAVTEAEAKAKAEAEAKAKAANGNADPPPPPAPERPPAGGIPQPVGRAIYHLFGSLRQEMRSEMAHLRDYFDDISASGGAGGGAMDSKYSGPSLLESVAARLGGDDQKQSSVPPVASAASSSAA